MLECIITYKLVRLTLDCMPIAELNFVNGAWKCAKRT